MKQQDFEHIHARTWDDFEIALTQKHGDASRHELPEVYQNVCHHLALAKQRQYSSNLVSHLNNLVIEAHNQIYGPIPRFKANFVYFLVYGFPQTIRNNYAFVLWASALFFLPGFLFFGLCATDNDLIYSLMSFEQVRGFEAMYDSSNDTFGRERNSDSDLMMFGFYIYNNIGISFQTFASGIVFGIGSIFFLVYNGIYIGAAAGHITQVGYTDTFFPFVVGHGSFELVAIALAGGAGLKLGWSLICPGQYTRKSALKLAAKDAIVIVYGTTVMLIIAAFIEAFWSSSSVLPNTVKYAVGGVLWLAVLYYLIFFGRRNAAKSI